MQLFYTGSNLGPHFKRSHEMTGHLDFWLMPLIWKRD